MTNNEQELPMDENQKAQAAADRHAAFDALAESVDFETLRKSYDAANAANAAEAKPAPTNDQRVLEAEQQVLKAHAELENFRKRMQRDSDQQLKYANLPMLRDLLDIIDNLNRAKESARGESANVEALLSGVEMVSQQFATVLAKYGCKPVSAVGSEFDPNYHEAIAQTASDEHAAGVVAQEVAVGYILHDRVVRPSCVIVSTGPASADGANPN
jgi:molecular chaperone GrpE